MCSFLGCNLSIPFSLGDAVPLSGETGSCETEYHIITYVNVRKTLFSIIVRDHITFYYTRVPNYRYCILTQRIISLFKSILPLFL